MCPVAFPQRACFSTFPDAIVACAVGCETEELGLESSTVCGLVELDVLLVGLDAT